MIESITSSDVIVPSVTLALGFVVRMIFDRKKLKAENDSAQLDADTKAVALYEQYANRIQTEFNRLSDTVQSLRAEVDQLKQENSALKVDNAQLREENAKLHVEIQGFNDQITKLKLQVSKTKKS